MLFLDEPTTGLDPASRSRVWQEVRSINEKLGVSIFLTTQYLEEADALAHRVGIINRGELAAQGTPSELKRARGDDLIIAKVDGDVDAAVEAVKGTGRVNRVEVHGNELTASVANGAALVSAVALALDHSGIGVQELTLRTPTLDDVFLQVTGERLQGDSGDWQQPEEDGTAAP